jgi:hypothetical protein
MKQQASGMDVDILSDYGLTVESPVMDDVLSGALRPQEPANNDVSQAQQEGGVKRCSLGTLSVNVNAHERFLSVADEAMKALQNAQHRQASGAAQGDALKAAEAAYRLGAAALAMGLGHISLLAESLGLAWRLAAHAQMAADAEHFAAPDATALEQASRALQAMLLKVAAGMTQPDATGAMTMLGNAIAHAIGQLAADA